jgi:serralysin
MLTVPPPDYAQGFYTKAFEWKGIYVLANNQVPDEAVYRAAEIVFNSIAKDPELAKALAANDARFAVIPYERPITDLPDYADLPTLYPGTNWSIYRGLGGVLGRPTSSSGEENLLPTHPNDPYNHGESIGLHEWMHAVEGIALETSYPTLHAQFEAAYANRGALWNNTYAATNFYEYFAETAQSFFNDNASGLVGGDGIHNDIDTRVELQAYDPTAYNLLLQIFGNTSWDVGDFFGDAGANTFTGTPYADLMFGNNGADQLNGNNGDDRLIGGAQNDALNGGGGNDILEGEAGVDTYNGGAGNDTYVLGAETGESIADSSGTDTITSTISRSLAGYPAVENLMLLGSGAINGTGNALANVITGNGAANRLDGGIGIDTLTGGAGPDSFVFNAAVTAANADTITDFNPAADTIELLASVFPKLKLGVLKKKAFDSGKKKPAKDKHLVYYDEKQGDLWYDANGKKQKGKGDVLVPRSTPAWTSRQPTSWWRESHQRQRRLVEAVDLPRLHRQDVLDGAERLQVRLRDPAELEFVEAVERALDHRLEEGGQDAEGPVLRVGADAEHAGAADFRHQERHLDESQDVRRAAGAGERLVHVRHPHHVADELVAAVHGQHQIGDHHAHDAMREEIEFGRGDRREAPHRLADAIAKFVDVLERRREVLFRRADDAKLGMAGEDAVLEHAKRGPVLAPAHDAGFVEHEGVEVVNLREAGRFEERAVARRRVRHHDRRRIVVTEYDDAELALERRVDRTADRVVATGGEPFGGRRDEGAGCFGIILTFKEAEEAGPVAVMLVMEPVDDRGDTADDVAIPLR